jgi:hypothetical protein
MNHVTERRSALWTVAWLFALVLAVLLGGFIALQEYARYDLRTSPLLGSAGLPRFELAGVSCNKSDWLCFEYTSNFGRSSGGTAGVVRGFWSLSRFGPERYEVEMSGSRGTLRPL